MNICDVCGKPVRATHSFSDEIDENGKIKRFGHLSCLCKRSKPINDNKMDGEEVQEEEVTPEVETPEEEITEETIF